MKDGPITARVSTSGLAAFYAPDVLKIAALAAFAVTKPHPAVVAGAVFWAAVLIYFMWRRIQTSGFHGEIELDEREIRFRPDAGVGIVETLELTDVRAVRVEVWRMQKLLVISGMSDDAEIRLPDVYDVSAEELRILIDRRLHVLNTRA